MTGAAAQVKGAAAAQVKEAAAAHVNQSAPASPAPPQPAILAGGPIASDSWNKALQRPLTSAPEVVPLAEAAYRRPPPRAEKAKSNAALSRFSSEPAWWHVCGVRRIRDLWFAA